MKKKLILLLLLTTSLFSQGWNNVVTTSVPYSSGSKLDLFTNKDGNHLLVRYSNYPTYYLKYYLLNSSGSIVGEMTVESKFVESPNIVGNNDIVYLLYKDGNIVKGKKTTNAGQSWDVIPNRTISYSYYHDVDAVYGNGGVHIVYDVPDADYQYYETYYYKLNASNQWVDYQNVTNYTTSENGGKPRISSSDNRVHVSYNTYDAVAKTRDKVGTTWQVPQTVFSNQSLGEGLQAGQSKLFDFYYKLEPGEGNYHSDMYVANRDLGGSTWSSGALLQSYADVDQIVSSINTNDGKTHIFYEGPFSVVYRNYNGSVWSTEFTVGEGFESPVISASSNDLFTVWGRDDIYYENILYRQYDVAPLTPSNLSIAIVNEESVLSWSANIEPDVKISGGKYKIYRAETSGGEPTSFTLVATINAYNGDTPVTSWTDIESGKSYTRKLFYKISAVDKNLHESSLTNYVWRYGKIPKISTGEISNLGYQLFDNYPNPFNPSTKISYSIKEEGLVTLKVYDILGKEIATLVNENKPIGNYEVDFNASQLPSGMYIYKIQSGIFNDAKKMLLTK